MCGLTTNHPAIFRASVFELKQVLANDLDQIRERSEHTFPDKIPAEHLRLASSSTTDMDNDSLALSYFNDNDFDSDGHVQINMHHTPPARPIVIRFGAFVDGGDVSVREVNPLAPLSSAIPQSDIRKYSQACFFSSFDIRFCFGSSWAA